MEHPESISFMDHARKRHDAKTHARKPSAHAMIIPLSPIRVNQEAQAQSPFPKFNIRTSRSGP
jgi:hypothetical protein